jgi:hypothetical protein
MFEMECDHVEITGLVPTEAGQPGLKIIFPQPFPIDKHHRVWGVRDILVAPEPVCSWFPEKVERMLSLKRHFGKIDPKDTRNRLRKKACTNQIHKEFDFGPPVASYDPEDDMS